MAVDLSVFDRLKTKADYDREEEAFQLERLAKLHAASGNDPAAVKLANELGRARAAGDTQRINDLILSAKTFDKGVVTDAYGNPVAMGGYGDAVGSIAGTKKAYEANAQNASDLAYDPLIARGEADQRNTSETNYAAGIAQNTATGKLAGENQGNINKRAVQSQDNLSIINELMTPDESGKTILDKATGSTIGAGVAAGKGFFGKSDESTQANAELAVYAGKLLNNVPRMEGPQSDADLISYKEQAGKIADPRIPAKDKVAALRAIQNLSQKYAAQNTSNVGVTQPPALDPRNIPMNAVQYLKQNPHTAAQFDEMYGAGASKMVLGR